jgi:hypothetical protein
MWETQAARGSHEFRFSIFAFRCSGSYAPTPFTLLFRSWVTRVSIFHFRVSILPAQGRELRPPPLVRHKRTHQANHKQSQNGTGQDYDNQGPNLHSLYFRAGHPPIPSLYFQLLTDLNGKRVSPFSDTRCLFSTLSKACGKSPLFRRPGLQPRCKALITNGL